MPTKTTASTLDATSVDIMNAIRANGTETYQSYVPMATADIASIRDIGAIIMQFPALQNEFLSALVNRIGMVMITSKMYTNPWAVFKRGYLEFGETVEEIFVNIAKPFQFDPAVAENKVFARNIPDVRAAFHVLNFQKFYKVTIQNEQLRQAFLSWAGVTDLIAKIVDSMYSGAAYDEFLAMKYMIARHILDGNMHAVQISTVSDANMKGIAAAIKGVSNNFTFLKTTYNPAGVANKADKEEQYLIMNSLFDASMDVEVLASAFNMDKAQFMGHRVLVDNFGDLDTERLDDLFGEEAWYTPLSSADLASLNAVPAILVSRDFFMIFDNLQNFTENYNGEGLYWNYWYHVWKTISASPFANAVVFVPGAPSVTSVTVSPAAVTVAKGQQVQLSAAVVTSNFASQAVTWSISPATGASIDANGLLTVDSGFTGTSITVTATSQFDSTKAGTSTVTVS